MERSQIGVLWADPDPAAEFFDPLRYDTGGASTGAAITRGQARTGNYQLV